MKNFIDFTAQHFDDNGNPLTWGRVQCYEAGTINPKSLYTDALLTVEAPNPLPLMADGRPQYQCFMAAGSYKFRYDKAILNNGTPTGSYIDGYKVADNVEGELPPLSANSLIEYTLQTVVELRLIDGNSVAYNVANCLSYDGQKKTQIGGGRFKWDASSALPDNGGTVFNYNNNAQGRWLRVFEDNVLYPQMFGASIDSGVVAQASAFENAIEFLKVETINSLKMVIPSGNYFTNGSVSFDGDIAVEIDVGVTFSTTAPGTVSFTNTDLIINQKTALIAGENIELVVTPQKAIDIYPDWWLTDSANDSYTLYRAWLGTTRAATRNTIISRAYTIILGQTSCDIGIFNAKFVGASSINLQTTTVTCSFFGTFENSSITTPLVVDNLIAGAGLFYTDALTCATDLSWFGTSLNSSQLNSIIRAITNNGVKIGEIEIATPITFVSGGATSIKIANPSWLFSTRFLKNGVATVNATDIHFGEIDSSTVCLLGSNVPLCDNSRVDANWHCITGLTNAISMTHNVATLNYACLMAVTNAKPLTSNDCVIYINAPVALTFTPTFEDFRVLGSGIASDYALTFAEATDFVLTMKRCEIYQGFNTLSAHCTKFFADSCIFKSTSSVSALFVYTGELQINNSVIDSLSGTCTLSAGNFGTSYAVSSVRASRFLCPTLTAQYIAFKSCEFKGVGYGSINAVGGAMLDCSYFNFATTMTTDGDLRGVYMYNSNKLMSSRVYCVNPNNCTINDNQMLGADSNTNITIKGSVADTVITGLMCTGNNLVPNDLQPILYENLALGGHSKNCVEKNNVPFTLITNTSPGKFTTALARVDGTKISLKDFPAATCAYRPIPLASGVDLNGSAFYPPIQNDYFFLRGDSHVVSAQIIHIDYDPANSGSYSYLDITYETGIVSPIDYVELHAE